MIANFFLRPLLSAEFVSFMTETGLQIERETPEKLGIADIHPAFSETLMITKKTFDVLQGNTLTTGKAKADELRDYRYRSLVSYVKAFLFDETPAVWEAANAVMAVINKVGNPTKHGNNRETAEINELLSNLSPYTTQLEHIVAVSRMQALDEANQAFAAIQDQWYTTEGEKLSGDMKAARMQLEPLYKSIIQRINAMIIINGKENYKTFIDAHNAAIEQYQRGIAQRKGINAAKREAEAAKK